MARCSFPATVFLFYLLISIQGVTASYKEPSKVLRPQYVLNIRVMPEAHRLDVTGTMRIPPANVSRSEVQLSLSKLMRDFTVEVLEPAGSAGIPEVEKKESSGRSDKWVVRPVLPIPAGQHLSLRFSYTGGGQIAPFFHVGPEVSFASGYGTDWYPLVIGDNDRGVGSLRFYVPAGYIALSEGSRRSSPEEEARGEFRFDNPHQTYFSFAAGKYLVIQRTDTIPVSAYLLRPRPNMEEYLEGVKAILRVLEQEFGPYPFNELALVEVPRALANKAGFNAGSVQGFIYVNSNAFDLPASEFSAILGWYGHEFSHQWWPNKVALRTPPGLYMEEALAEYGGLRVVETLAGPAAAEQYRRTGYKPDPIYSALEYFKLVGAGLDYPLAELQPKSEHRRLAYNKGFLVWDMLSREIGRKQFQAILSKIIRKHPFKEITWRDFLREIEAGAGRSFEWFYEQWFERTGAPDWQLTWKQEGRMLRGTIAQRTPHYRAAIELQARGADSHKLVRMLEVRGPRTEFAWSVKFQVQSVVLDPHYLVLRWTPEYHAVADDARVLK